jgi:hypothetical protein
VRFNKKAVTPAISWILLIGLTVTMAGVVTVWIKSTAGETSETLVNNVDKDMRCVDTSFNAYENDGLFNCNEITIHNRGFFSIHSIKVRNGNKINDTVLDSPLKPQEIKTIYLNDLNLNINDSVGLIPIIKVQDEFLACMAKEISIECTPQ